MALALSIPTDQAFTMFTINMGEFFEREAEREGREMTPDEIGLYDSDLWTARRVGKRSKFNTSAMSPKELAQAQNAERKARVAQLAELVENLGILNLLEDEEGPELAESLEAPAFI